MAQTGSKVKDVPLLTGPVQLLSGSEVEPGTGEPEPSHQPDPNSVLPWVSVGAIMIIFILLYLNLPKVPSTIILFHAF